MRVQSTWKTAYAGSVGGQFLTAVGSLTRLARRLPNLVVWPLGTGFGRRPAAGEVWVAEVWPGEFHLEGPEAAAGVRDADQVWSTVRALRRADEQETLTDWLSGPPDEGERSAALQEGWPLSPTLAGRKH
jgi:hypothetical protein